MLEVIMLKKLEIQENNLGSLGAHPKILWCHWSLGASFLSTSPSSKIWPLNTSEVNGCPFLKDFWSSSCLLTGTRCPSRLQSFMQQFPAQWAALWLFEGDHHHHHPHLWKKEKGCVLPQVGGECPCSSSRSQWTEQEVSRWVDQWGHLMGVKDTSQKRQAKDPDKHTCLTFLINLVFALVYTSYVPWTHRQKTCLGLINSFLTCLLATKRYSLSTKLLLAPG